jgi:phosphoenolpyruvate carboxylase
MSTQHPDNVAVPFFSSSSALALEDEVREAYYAFSQLGCDEQMWDVEGKEVDTHVVKKLLSLDERFFRTQVLGEDVRLTLRVPNPTAETTEAKVLLETLENIPRSFDAARLFYGRDIAPIFEVILPMTTSARCIDRVYRYYKDFIVGRQSQRLGRDDVTIAEWIGTFSPQSIDVIPLFEDVPSMLGAASMLEDYLADKEVTDQRVFLARSDTAMNYGLVSAALANKIALYDLDLLAERLGVRLHPILGVGSAPFRGGLSPATAERVGGEYPSVVTFTIQSAFKYDYPAEEVRAGVRALRERPIGRATPVDMETARPLMERYSTSYRERIAVLADVVNDLARFVPSRRARKLHVGLFGYARQVDGITLPRAISFTCAMYSAGLPPELLSLDSLEPSDFDYLRSAYPSFDVKIADALRFCDMDGPLMTRELRDAVLRAGYDWSPDEEHLAIVRSLAEARAGSQEARARDLLTQAGNVRQFLG